MNEYCEKLSSGLEINCWTHGLKAAIIAYVNLLQDQSSHHYSVDGEWVHTSLSLVEELLAADASE